jgi:hypothetical protein
MMWRKEELLCIAAQNVRSAIVAETGWQFLKGLKMQ